MMMSWNHTGVIWNRILVSDRVVWESLFNEIVGNSGDSESVSYEYHTSLLSIYYGDGQLSTESVWVFGERFKQIVSSLALVSSSWPPTWSWSRVELPRLPIEAGGRANAILSFTLKSSRCLKLRAAVCPGSTAANTKLYPHAEPAVNWRRDDLARCYHGCYHRYGAAPWSRQCRRQSPRPSEVIFLR